MFDVDDEGAIGSIWGGGSCRDMMWVIGYWWMQVADTAELQAYLCRASLPVVDPLGER